MINVIVAHDLNGIIGKDGKIPWNIRGEQKQFKQLTTNNIIIMGRKTYEDIGHPLPNRENIVISKTLIDNRVKHYSSLKKAISICLATSDKDIYIIGGGRLYREVQEKGIPIDNYYITVINMEVKDGDTKFPNFDKSMYDVEITEKNDKFTRYRYYKKGDK